MDVDALSIKAREEAMRKGACFGCGEIGHISRNCPKKKGKQDSLVQYFTVPHRFRSEPVGTSWIPIGSKLEPNFRLVSDWF